MSGYGRGRSQPAELNMDTEGQTERERERVSTWHTEQDRSSEHRDRGTEQERSAGGLVTHGHPGIFTDKRKRKEKEEPVDT